MTDRPAARAGDSFDARPQAPADTKVTLPN